MKIDERLHFPALGNEPAQDTVFGRAIRCREELIRRTREARAAELRRARAAEAQRTYDQD